MLPDIGFPELLIIAVIAIIVVGPKDLPKMLRKIGQFMAKARSMAREFQRSFSEMARETELDDLGKEMSALKANNPLSQVKDELKKTLDPLRDEVDQAVKGDDFGGHNPTGLPSKPKDPAPEPQKPPEQGEPKT